MKVNAVTDRRYFGIKLAPDFAESVVKNCAKISFDEAEKMVAKLREMPPADLYLTKVSSNVKSSGFLGPKYRHIHITYETKNPDNTTIFHSYGDTQQKKTPFSAKEIFNIIKDVINRN